MTPEQIAKFANIVARGPFRVELMDELEALLDDIEEKAFARGLAACQTTHDGTWPSDG